MLKTDEKKKNRAFTTKELRTYLKLKELEDSEEKEAKKKRHEKREERHEKRDAKRAEKDRKKEPYMEKKLELEQQK